MANHWPTAFHIRNIRRLYRCGGELTFRNARLLQTTGVSAPQWRDIRRGEGPRALLSQLLPQIDSFGPLGRSRPWSHPSDRMAKSNKRWTWSSWSGHPRKPLDCLSDKWCLRNCESCRARKCQRTKHPIRITEMDCNIWRPKKQSISGAFSRRPGNAYVPRIDQTNFLPGMFIVPQDPYFLYTPQICKCFVNGANIEVFSHDFALFCSSLCCSAGVTPSQTTEQSPQIASFVPVKSRILALLLVATPTTTQKLHSMNTLLVYYALQINESPKDTNLVGAMLRLLFGDIVQPVRTTSSPSTIRVHRLTGRRFQNLEINFFWELVLHVFCGV